MLKCEYCEKEFATISSLNKHQKSAKFCLEIQGKKNNTFVCVCEKVFTCRENLDKHKKNVILLK
jgi:hypothetical protein